MARRIIVEEAIPERTAIQPQRRGKGASASATWRPSLSARPCRRHLVPGLVGGSLINCATGSRCYPGLPLTPPASWIGPRQMVVSDGPQDRLSSLRRQTTQGVGRNCSSLHLRAVPRAICLPLARVQQPPQVHSACSRPMLVTRHAHRTEFAKGGDRPDRPRWGEASHRSPHPPAGPRR